MAKKKRLANGERSRIQSPEQKDLVTQLESKMKAEHWSIAHIELCKEFLLTGDISKASKMYEAPKDLIVNWIRTKLTELAITTSSDKVQHECFKTLLTDIRGPEEPGQIKVELVLKNPDGSAVGAKIETT